MKTINKVRIFLIGKRNIIFNIGLVLSYILKLCLVWRSKVCKKFRGGKAQRNKQKKQLIKIEKELNRQISGSGFRAYIQIVFKSPEG